MTDVRAVKALWPVYFGDKVIGFVVGFLQARSARGGGKDPATDSRDLPVFQRSTCMEGHGF